MIGFDQFLSDLANPALAFLPKALLVSMMSALVCGIVGTHVVLRGMAFIGDAVAHAVFPGIVVAFAVQGSILLGGAVAGAVVAILIAVFSQRRQVKEDATIGIFFAAAFALGLVIISWVQGNTASLTSFLFGSITGVSDQDIVLVAACGAAVLFILMLFNKEIVAVSIDRETAAAQGIRVLAIDLVLYLAVTAAVVISVRTIGNILVLALLVTPAATARLWTNSVRMMMVLSALIGSIGSFIGVYLSWSIDVPTGATIVLVLTVAYFLSYFCPASLRKLSSDKPSSHKKLSRKEAKKGNSVFSSQKSRSTGSAAAAIIMAVGVMVPVSVGELGVVPHAMAQAVDAEDTDTRFVIPVTGAKNKLSEPVDGFGESAYSLNVETARQRLSKDFSRAEVSIKSAQVPEGGRMLLVDGSNILLDTANLGLTTVGQGKEYLFSKDGNYDLTLEVKGNDGATDQKISVRFAVGTAAEGLNGGKGGTQASQITGIVAAMKDIESKLNRLAVVIPAMVDAWRGLFKLDPEMGSAVDTKTDTKTGTKTDVKGQPGQDPHKPQDVLVNVDKHTAAEPHAATPDSGKDAGGDTAKGTGVSANIGTPDQVAKALGFSADNSSSPAVETAGSSGASSGLLPIAPGYSSSESAGASSNGQGVHKIDTAAEDHSVPETQELAADGQSAKESGDEESGDLAAHNAASANSLASSGFTGGLVAGFGLAALLGGLLFFALAIRNYQRARSARKN